MRKSLLLFILISCIAAAKVKAQYINIPDAIFRSYLQENFPSCMNGQGQLDTTCSTILAVENLLISENSPGCIVDLTGLQYFKNLKRLNIPLHPCLDILPVIDSLKELRAAYTPVKLSSLPNGLKIFDVGTGAAEGVNVNAPFINDSGHWPDSLEFLSCQYAFNPVILPPFPALLKHLDLSAVQHVDFDSLPSLPTTLQYLNCSNLKLRRLPQLPVSLTYINCSIDPPYGNMDPLPPMPPQLRTFEFTGRMIKALPAMPASLIYFSCWGTDSTTTFPLLPEGLKTFLYTYAPSLRTMPPLPNSIVNIKCWEVGLSSLQSLPASLKRFEFVLDTFLTSLPPFPSGLTTIICHSNKLASLPALPPLLDSLHCGTNALRTLPSLLPASTRYLNCSNNQLAYLPYLYEGLKSLYCSNNQLIGLKNIPSSLQILDIRQNNLSCLPFIPFPSPAATVRIYADPAIECISSANPFLLFYQNSTISVIPPACNLTNNIHQCESYPIITGYLFYDLNTNGIKDPGEEGVQNEKVTLGSAGDHFSFTDNDGRYVLQCDSIGTFTVAPVAWTYFLDFVPASASFNFSTYDTTVYKDFGIVPNTTLDSVAVTITCINTPRPGFPVGYHVTYTNTGTTTLVNPVLTIAYDDTRLTFDSSAVAGLNHTGNNLILNASGMTPLEQGNLTAWFRVKPTTPIGDSLIAGASLAANSKIATSFSRVIIRGSFDPNDKQATAQLSPLQVINGDYIDYTIRFQNTGTDTAFNVVITDTLDENLKTSSLQLMATSHNCKTTVIDNVVYFEFLHILLPDSNINEPLSHGFVSFRLQPQTSVAVNSIIPNKAAIYFDYNAPVITNTAGTLIKNFTVVPWRLISFSAVAQTENTTLLSWITSNEINTQYFKIERSNDGLQFDYITTITAKGKAYNNYNTVLNEASTGIVYYRLKIMDKDGSFVYSPVIKMDRRKNTTGITILSNPVKGFLNINAADRNVHNTAAGIINMQGAVVKTLILKEGSQTIDLGGLPPGMYYIRTTSGNEKFLLR